MTTQFFKITQNQEGWQSMFAFQVFQRSAEEWGKFRWGFNAGALFEEALDRQKLFLESQAITEIQFFDESQPIRTLAIRVINQPGKGVQMALIGMVAATDQTQAEQAGQDYAREVYSTFPYDFILNPCITETGFEQLTGVAFFTENIRVASIQRANAYIPPMKRYQYMQGFWQSNTRANEQIWRALSNMPQPAMLNIMMRPSFLYEDEKEFMLKIKKSVLDAEEKPDIFLPYHPWMESWIKRRLAPWKKFFQLQVHVLAAGAVDENLLRSIGAAITRDLPENALPGFQIERPNSADEEKEWREGVNTLTLIPVPRRMDDLADLDEVFSVFRLPLQQEIGLPGVNFIDTASVD